ncbi:MAG: class I mannose-6-phosphate isomerase [Bacilli bacterium]|jgi:mannose-6-phosphate isomerase|nr:class I mannose-6-phosphate isomerase [Bacilli bacterium]
MGSKILFLTAPLKERIWGSSYFNEVLHLSESKEKLGELWSCSGLKESSSLIVGGEFAGWSLADLYQTHQDLFGSKEKEFPLLVKLLSTSDRLSIQVHPDDALAASKGLPSGKSEGWLILSSDEKSGIVYGTSARNKEELEAHVKNNDYGSILQDLKVEPGDFIPIPAGTIHALGKDLLVLEIQQSADVTYRFYDYDRLDKDGKKRPLQTKEAIEATKFASHYCPVVKAFENLRSARCLWDNEHFSIDLIRIEGPYFLRSEEVFGVISLAVGEVSIQGKVLHLGESVVLLKGGECEISGSGIIAFSKPKK